MKPLYALLPLVALLSFSSCSEEEEPCDPAKEEALARREAELDQREADLLARERALGGRSGNSGNSGGDVTYSTGARAANVSDGNYAAASGRSNTRSSGRSRAVPAQDEDRVAYRKAIYFPGQYPEASERTLTAADLEHKSDWGKKVMMNEIYARYGLIFTEPDLRKHFNGESWYKGSKKNVDGKLTPVERQNIALIRASM